MHSQLLMSTGKGKAPQEDRREYNFECECFDFENLLTIT